MTAGSVEAPSSSPFAEWQALGNTLGPELLARSVGTVPSSRRQNVPAEHEAPDVVAARLRFLALVVEDLAGAYSDVGIRGWFQRERTALDGRAPAELLADGWMPDDEGPERVKRLAARIRSGTTT